MSGVGDTDFRLGIKAYKEKRYDDAADLLLNVVTLDQNNHKAWNALGVTLSRMGDKGQASTCFQNALSLDPVNEVYQKNLTKVSGAVQSEPVRKTEPRPKKQDSENIAYIPHDSPFHPSSKISEQAPSQPVPQTTSPPPQKNRIKISIKNPIKNLKKPREAPDLTPSQMIPDLQPAVMKSSAGLAEPLISEIKEREVGAIPGAVPHSFSQGTETGTEPAEILPMAKTEPVPGRSEMETGPADRETDHIRTEYLEVGETLPNCPSCGKAIEDFPDFKIICPHCDEPIYPRNRPLDFQKVLVKESEIEIIESEWEKYHKEQVLKRLNNKILPKDSKERYQEIKERLSEEHAIEPSVFEVLWEANTKNSEIHFKEGKFAQCRTNLYAFGELLRLEGKNTEALAYLFKVVYLDINGVSDAGLTSKDIFSVARSTTDQAIIDEIKAIQGIESLNRDDLKERYIKAAEEINQLFSAYPIPYPPEYAWNLITGYFT